MQNEMTEEEMKQATEQAQKDWDDFVASLEKHADDPATKADLLKIIEFCSGMGQMVGMNNHNIQALAHNLGQIMQALQGGGPGPIGKTTKSGIFLP